MTGETWHDRPSADAPVKWTPAGGMEPDAWLSMDDACDRLLRLQGWDPRDTEADLLAGRVLFTPYASYMLDPDASA